MKVNNKLFEEMSAMCKEAGVEDMFSDEAIVKQRVTDVAAYHKEHGKYPASTSKDPKVKRLGRWLVEMRAAKKRSEMLMVPIKSKDIV